MNAKGIALHKEFVLPDLGRLVDSMLFHDSGTIDLTERIKPGEVLTVRSRYFSFMFPRNKDEARVALAASLLEIVDALHDGNRPRFLTEGSKGDDVYEFAVTKRGDVTIRWRVNHYGHGSWYYEIEVSKRGNDIS